MLSLEFAIIDRRAYEICFSILYTNNDDYVNKAEFQCASCRFQIARSDHDGKSTRADYMKRFDFDFADGNSCVIETEFDGNKLPHPSVSHS